MNAVTKSIIKLSITTAVGISGFYVGKYSEQLNAGGKDSEASILSNVNIKQMPGLPLFGTVSAATTLVPTENQSNPFWSKTATRTGEIMKYGFPSLDHIRSYEDFVLSYDRRNRVAHWVFEHLNKEKLKQNEEVSRSKCEFKPDPSIHHFFRSDNSDYRGSGYDRGHLAAAGNHKSCQRHIEQTFYLTNMAPQVGKGFNRDSWNRLEKHVRQLTKTNKEVYVCTGPLYLPKKEKDGKKYVRYEVIGENCVAVPTHFYKIVVVETNNSDLEMEAFVMPNTPIDDKTPLTNFLVPPETIERYAGLLFFDRITRSKLNKINGEKVT